MRLVVQETGPTAAVAAAPPLRVSLCGELRVDVDGQRVEAELPGRRGRLLLAYLALHREFPVAREDLIAALWDGDAVAAPRAALSVLLSRTRHAVAPGVLAELPDRRLGLAEDAEVDIDSATAALEGARLALSRRDHTGALAAARVALATFELPLLPGAEAEWLEDHRRRVAEQRALALETVAEAALGVDGVEQLAALRAARELVELEPFHESGYTLLMRCQAAAGNQAEAIRTYDALRTLLRDSLAMTPSAQARGLAERILGGEAQPRPGPRPHLPAPLRLPARVPLCGRDAEIQKLNAWWSAPADGVRVCVLDGEPGIGKTRLAAELAQRAERDGAAVLYGRSDDNALPVPYQPIIEAVRHLLVHAGVPSSSERAEELAELARLVPELRSAGYAPADPPGDPQLRRFRLFEAVATLLAGPSSSGGLLLVLDDLQWADEPTIALLRHLLRLEVDGKLAALVLFRTTDVDDDHPLLGGLASARRERPFARVSLTGLDAPAVARMVQAAVPAGGTARFSDALVQHTGGNPLFVAEFLRELAGTGLCDDRAADLDDIARVGVPEGAQEVVRRRLGRLGTDTTEILSDAAAIGLEFDLRVLERLSTTGVDGLAALERALDAGIVVERTPPGRFAFAHALVHDAVASRRSRARQARTQGRLARLLAADPELGATLADLARHWDAAGEPVPALDASLAAGRAADDVGAFDEALAHYSRALELWSAAGRPPDERLPVLEVAAESARWAGHPARAAELLYEGLARSAGDDREARLRERRGRYLWEAGDWDGSMREYRAAVERLRGLPPSVESARALAGQAALLMLRERFSESADRAAEALLIARSIGARREEGHALNTHGVDLAMTGRGSEGIAELREALAIAREVGCLEDECRAYCNLSELLMRAGETEDAAAIGRTGYDFARRHGLERSGAPIIAANAVAALARLGRWDEAERLADESLREALPDGTCAYLCTIRGQLCALRGDTDTAAAHLERARMIVQDAFEPALVVELQAALAELALAGGDRGGARRAVERGLEILDAEDECGDLLLRLCMLGLSIGRDDEREGAWRARLAERAAAVSADMERAGALLPAAAAFAAGAEAEHVSMKGEPAADAWTRAAAAFARLGDQYGVARAHLRQAQALRTEHRDEEATASMGAAASIARSLRAEPLEREISLAAATARAAQPTG